jgi:hypothetical protein
VCWGGGLGCWQRGPVPAVGDELGEEGAEHVDGELDCEDDGERGVELVEEVLEGGVGVDVVVVRLDDVEYEVERDQRRNDNLTAIACTTLKLNSEPDFLTRHRYS